MLTWRPPQFRYHSDTAGTVPQSLVQCCKSWSGMPRTSLSISYRSLMSASLVVVRYPDLLSNMIFRRFASPKAMHEGAEVGRRRPAHLQKLHASVQVIKTASIVSSPDASFSPFGRSVRPGRAVGSALRPVAVRYLFQAPTVTVVSPSQKPLVTATPLAGVSFLRQSRSPPEQPIVNWPGGIQTYRCWSTGFNHLSPGWRPVVRSTPWAMMRPVIMYPRRISKKITGAMVRRPKAIGFAD